MKIFLLVLLMLPSLAKSKDVSSLVYNESKNEIIVGDNLNMSRPIASLTKLMTAMVSLDYDGNLQRKIKMIGSNKLPGGEYTREDLMTAMLVRSDNGAADSIAADYPGGRKAFIAAMNKKSQDIGMVFTKFVDPSGLSSGNTSNAGSVGIMLQVAALYPFIKESTVKKNIQIKRKKYSIILENTNKNLLYSFDEILLSKTGFTNAAGWNVGVVLEKNNQKFSVVVLGAKSKEQRYEITKKLIDRYFQELALEQDTEIVYNKTFLEKIIDWFHPK
jgi:D-alanyl-D-alanine endopeptidase (penicillin-binding protein 7)